MQQRAWCKPYMPGFAGYCHTRAARPVYHIPFTWAELIGKQSWEKPILKLPGRNLM